MSDPNKALVTRTLDGSPIHQRRADGYVNATALCQAAGKRLNDYTRLQSTTEFLAELAAVTGIPAAGLVQVRQGGTPDLQGTWVHPDLAVNLAQWCSPRFAVQVSQWVRELLSTGRVEVQPPAKRRVRIAPSEEWADVRERGVEQRKGFTDVLKDHEVVKEGYAACTNAIYVPVLGGTAQEVRASRQLVPRKNLRDQLATSDLIRVMFAETIASERIERDDLRGNVRCAGASRVAGQAVATALRLADDTPT